MSLVFELSLICGPEDSNLHEFNLTRPSMTRKRNVGYKPLVEVHSLLCIPCFCLTSSYYEVRMAIYFTLNTNKIIFYQKQYIHENSINFCSNDRIIINIQIDYNLKIIIIYVLLFQEPYQLRIL